MTQPRPSAVILGALAAVLIVAGVLADRLGASASVTATLVLVLSVLSMAACGLSAGTMRMSVFQAGGPDAAVLLVVSGLAVVGLGMAMLQPGPQGLIRPDVVLCFAAAVLVYAIALANPIARAGGFSFGDVIHWRYRSRSIAALAVLAGLTGVLCLLALAATTAVRMLAQAGTISVVSAQIIVGLLGLVSVLPGGAKSVAAVAGVAVMVMIAGWGIPAALLASASGPDRWIVLASVPDAAFGQLDLQPEALGGCMAALGILLLVHLPIPAAHRRSGHRGGALAALAILALAFTAVAGEFLTQRTAGAFARLPAVARALHDLTPALVVTALFAAMLHVAARAITHDVIYRLAGRSGTASGQMALQRLVAIGLAATAVAGGLPRVLSSPEGVPATVIVMLTAAIPGPLLLLGLWRRADWRAAACGLFSAAFAVAAVVAGYIGTGPGLTAGALSCLVAGSIAAALFPARDAETMAAADVLTGARAGGLTDRSA